MNIKLIEKSSGHGGFVQLVGYALQDHKVDWTWMSQTVVSQETAALEMQCLAALRPQCKTPAVHIDLSWSPKDTLTPERMKACVERVVKRLRLEGHLAIAVAHKDAMHRHVHVIINRIHPETLRVVPLVYPKYALLALGRELDREFGFHTSHPKLDQPVQVGLTTWRLGDLLPYRMNASATRRAIHGGRASFQEWIVGEPRAALVAALSDQKADWNRVHGVFALYGLRYELYGKGATIVDATLPALRARAGQLAACVSLPKLQRLIGPFRPAPTNLPVPTTSYALAMIEAKKQPWGPPELVEGYKQYRAALTDSRLSEWRSQTRHEARRRAFLLESFAQRRAELGTTATGLALRPALDRKALALEKQLAIEVFNARIHVERERYRREVLALPRPLSARAWVIREAKAGDQLALQYLSDVRDRQHFALKPPAIPGLALPDLTPPKVALPAPSRRLLPPRLQPPALRKLSEFEW